MGLCELMYHQGRGPSFKGGYGRGGEEVSEDWGKEWKSW